jgi:2-hydroxy-6-oxonona-2,4-dienedioate hydrolase
VGSIELMSRELNGALTLKYVKGWREAAPIVMLPGLFAGGWIWEPTSDFLVAEGFSVLTISEPFAALDTASASVDTPQSALTGALDQFEIPRAVVCGNSFGALVALDTAYHHPSRVESLVISGCPGLENGVSRSNLTLGVPDAAGIVEKMFFDRSAIPGDLIEKSLAAVTGRRCQMNMIRYLIAIREYNVRRSLSSVGCDTLMIWGENDLIAPVEQWEHHGRLMVRGSLRKVPRCGHSPMIERPAEFNAILTRFLACAPFSRI